MDELYSRLTESPFKLKTDFIQSSDATVSWIWLSSARDQSKILPTLNALARKEHYESIRFMVSGTAIKNKKLINQVLRIHVELNTKQVDDGIAVPCEEETNGRPVVF